MRFGADTARVTAPSEFEGGAEAITVAVVSHNSTRFLRECLEAAGRAAPKRGARLLVVDNASDDDSCAVARSIVGDENVTRLETNRGFAAGVNVVLTSLATPWLAVINPDLLLGPGSLDALAKVLEGAPGAGLAGPRILRPDGGVERSAGRFPTLSREWSHALALDRLLHLEGRLRDFPAATASVDWLTGSAWLLRARAIADAGPLDEDYFMYCEDIDYCRRLRQAGWDVLAVPSVEVFHEGGGGSASSRMLPADGGGFPLLHYAVKFGDMGPLPLVRLALTVGWLIRACAHSVLALLGRRRSRQVARRYWLALTSPRTPLRIDTFSARD